VDRAVATTTATIAAIDITVTYPNTITKKSLHHA